jgi:hypothetical protein
LIQASDGGSGGPPACRGAGASSPAGRVRREANAGKYSSGLRQYQGFFRAAGMPPSTAGGTPAATLEWHQPERAFLSVGARHSRRINARRKSVVFPVLRPSNHTVINP